jgi:GxxExxY protein
MQDDEIPMNVAQDTQADGPISDMHANRIATRVIDSAREIHKKIGPGRLDSVYAASLADILADSGFTVETQETIPIRLRGRRFNRCPRAPLVVGGTLLVESKSLKSLSRVHRKQVLTYLKLSNLRYGLLINFGGEHLAENIERLETDRATVPPSTFSEQTALTE